MKVLTALLSAIGISMSFLSMAQAETILVVSYSGDSSSKFDKQYYVKDHLPLVQKSWSPYGLIACSALFPSSYEAGVVAIAICRFRDDPSLDKAFASKETAAVLADVKNFTDLEPHRTKEITF